MQTDRMFGGSWKLYNNGKILQGELYANNDIRTFPCGEADCYWLSHETENAVAKKLYDSFGFKVTGDVAGGEVISLLKL